MIVKMMMEATWKMKEDLEDLVDDNSDIEDDILMYRTLKQQEQAAEIEHLQQRYMEIENDNESDSLSDGNETDDGEGEGKERGVVYPVRITKKELARHVNLLLTERDGALFDH